jgi:DNA-binding MarR family transcriptional regulator
MPLCASSRGQTPESARPRADLLGQIPNVDGQLCFALYAASHAVARAYEPILEPLGLSYTQYFTMLVMWESTTPVSVGELGARLGLDSGTMSPLLKRLESMGLVVRQRDATDERRVLVALTPTGTGMATHAASIPSQILERYDTDPAVLVEIRDQLIEIARKLRTDPAAAGE